jgi:hypothetical protein
MSDIFETTIKNGYGKVKLCKGFKLYHMLKDISDNNDIFYFHTSESNVRRLGYLFEERYEVTEDIELPVLFWAPYSYRLIPLKYVAYYHKINNMFKYGCITTTPTGSGLQLIIKNKEGILQKISEPQKIKYGWLEENESIYPFYINSAGIILYINTDFQNHFEKYIKYHKDSNWINSLIILNDKNPIEYFEYDNS